MKMIPAQCCHSSVVVTVGIALAVMILSSNGFTFTNDQYYQHTRVGTKTSSSWSWSSSSTSIEYMSSNTPDHVANSMEGLNLTPELTTLVNGFARIRDEKVRYKNLVYLANHLEAVGDDVRIPANKVPGCLSTVHVTCRIETTTTNDNDDDDNKPAVVQFRGDSDGILTKGLLAMLVRGLSGCTPEQIEAVDPQFIQVAGIAQTLTPGRNNGFLNMMDTMKRKAREAVEANDSNDTTTTTTSSEKEESSSTEQQTTTTSSSTSLLYQAILDALTPTLRPTSIRLVELTSAENGEHQFRLDVVAEVFDEVADPAKRQQLIVLLLGELMPQIQALEIHATGPSESLSE